MKEKQKLSHCVLSSNWLLTTRHEPKRLLQKEINTTNYLKSPLMSYTLQQAEMTASEVQVCSIICDMRAAPIMSACHDKSCQHDRISRKLEILILLFSETVVIMCVIISSNQWNVWNTFHLFKLCLKLSTQQKPKEKSLHWMCVSCIMWWNLDP